MGGQDGVVGLNNSGGDLKIIAYEGRKAVRCIRIDDLVQFWRLG